MHQCYDALPPAYQPHSTDLGGLSPSVHLLLKQLHMLAAAQNKTSSGAQLICPLSSVLPAP